MKVFFICFLLFCSMLCIAQSKKDTSNSFWNTGYADLPFWNSTFSHNGGRGYIDTFSVWGYKFRIVHNDTAFDGIGESYRNGQWIEDLDFLNLGNHNDYNRTTDVNNDGHVDLILSWKWNTEIFLFNPKTHLFNDSSFYLPFDWTLIDKSKNIFCSFFSHWWVNENYSDLYTFINNRPVTLYTLKYYGGKSQEDETIKKVVLLKTLKPGVNTKIKEIVINSKVFDYEAFWKRNYKKLLIYEK